MSKESCLKFHVKAKMVVDVKSTEGTSTRRGLEGLGSGTAGLGQEDDEDGNVEGTSEGSVERGEGRICVPEFYETVGYGRFGLGLVAGCLPADASLAGNRENFFSDNVGRGMGTRIILGYEGHGDASY